MKQQRWEESEKRKRQKRRSEKRGRERARERERERERESKRKDQSARKGRKVVKPCVFLMSKSSLAKAACAEPSHR